MPIPIDDPAEPEVRLTHQDWRLEESQPNRWSCDNPGVWPVSVHGGCDLQIRVYSPPDLKAPYRLRLECGPWSLEREMECRTNIEVFDSPQLTVGRHGFSALFIQGNKTYGALRVEVLRKPGGPAKESGG